MTEDAATYHYLLTAAADYLGAALNEMRRPARVARVRRFEPLSEELALLDSPLDLGELFARLQEREPIFVRHLVPVQRHLSLPSDGDRALAQLVAETIAMEEVQSLLPGERFSVQARVLSEPGATRPFTPYAIAQAIAPQVAEQSGATVDVRDPELVISVLATAEEAFVGVSPVIFNRSDWAGGERRFRREKGQVSRSEFKLLEALEVFGIELPATGAAVDLGAAPGGWTRVLREQGLPVLAVDPATLDPRIARDRQVRHLRTHTQEWLEQAIASGEKYDILLSDMRMDARDAARLMVAAAPLMHLDSLALLTLKLPAPDATGMDPISIMYDALNELRSRFRTVRARQLFHNRNEVTVLLKV